MDNNPASIIPTYLNFYITCYQWSILNSQTLSRGQVFCNSIFKIQTLITQSSYEDISLNTDLGNETFTQRFSVLLNTYWSALYNYESTHNGHPSILLVDSGYYGYYESLHGTSTTDAITTLVLRPFAYSRAWFAVLVISICILMVSSVCKPFLDLHICIPNLKINTSTLLHGNIEYYPSIPNSGSAIGDNTRSKILHHYKVRFGYRPIAKHAEGLWIGELDEEKGFVWRVMKGEKYFLVFQQRDDNCGQLAGKTNWC